MRSFSRLVSQKGLSVITEVAGTVEFVRNGKRKDIIVTTESGEEHEYQIPYGAMLKVRDGQHVKPGEQLTQGSINPHDILRVNGVIGFRTTSLKRFREFTGSRVLI